MSRPGSASAPFDPEAVHAKYLAERDKRLVEGRADIRDLDHDESSGTTGTTPSRPSSSDAPVGDEVDVVILGGGIAGVLAGAELRKRGVERIRIVDQAGGIGGTWYWNRYPGVMCDVESYIYMPMLEEFGYIPTRRYASGDEIRGHLERIAERYRLDDDALFHTDVTRAEWHDDEARWHVHTDRGDDVACRWYVLAAGILNLMKLPCIPGMEDFAGHSFHTARWDYDYTGGGANEPLDKLEGKDDRAPRHGRVGHPVRAAPGRVGQARLRVPAHALGHRRTGKPPHRRRLRAGPRARLAEARGWTTSRPSCSGAQGRPRRRGRRVDAPLRRRQQPAATSRA